jgi:hypothetical protein
MNKEVMFGNVASISRRHLARNVVATAAITMVPTIATVAEKTAPTPASTLGPRPEGLSVADWDEVNAKYANLLRVYEDRLSLEQKHSLVKILTTNQHMLASIRSFGVQNGDPSACTLRIYAPKSTQ